MIILGIDPGEDGAAALVDRDSRELIELLPFKERQFAPALLVLAQKADVVYLEHVHSFPGQGVVSTFTFGRMTGQAEAAVHISGKRCFHVEPQAWQNRLSLPRHANVEDRLKRRKAQRKDQEKYARKWYPQWLKDWDAGKQGDVFGGVLIARAGAEMELRKNPWYKAQMTTEAASSWRDLL